MWGTKAKVGNKKYSAYIAYNKSGDDTIGGAFINPWGSDPAYTSSLFSRNAYRQDVSAYKIGGHYTIMKGLKVIISHADYGKSKTLQSNKAGQFAVDNATETDIILAYKPTKEWMFKIFNARRTSEYNGIVIAAKTYEKEMNHYRFIASYSF